MANLEKIVEDLSSLTILEAAELAKLLEEKWGVSAAAAVAVAAGPAGGAAAAAPVEEKTEFTVMLDGGRRQEDRSHQGSPRDHRARPEGGQGPRRRRAEGRQGRRHQGRGREDQGPAREGRRQGRAQVSACGSPSGAFNATDGPGSRPGPFGRFCGGDAWSASRGETRRALQRKASAALESRVPPARASAAKPPRPRFGAGLGGG